MTGIEHEAAPLDGDVTHGRLPYLAIIYGRCTIDLDLLAIHGGPKERHVILPADHGAHATHVGLEHGQRRTVASTPDDPLHGGGHEFAVFSQQRSVLVEEQDAAIERAALALDHADHQKHGLLAGDGRQLVESRSWNVDGAVPVGLKLSSSFVTAAADVRPEGDALRVARKKRFGKQHQSRAHASGLRGQNANLRQRGVALERNGGILDDGNTNGAHDDRV